MSGARKSTLNPNAPAFVPAAIQQVEDFSPEWWDLVKTSTWFCDHWFRQYQEQEEALHGTEDDNDILNLLPDSFDLDATDELSDLELQFNDAAYHQPLEAEGDSDSSTPKKDKLVSEVELDTEGLLKNLSLNSPKNGFRSAMGQARYSEKPAQSVSPKSSPRRIIQQPR